MDFEKKTFKPKPDPILLKFYPDLHPLSAEEQAFYIKITEGACGYHELIRNEALKVLEQDHHIKYLVPYLCLFIRETVYTNIAFPDLSLLIYAMRMTKSLMSNPHVALKEHLHLILPAVLSCILSKKINKYAHDNHWTLRDFSSQIIASICCSHYSNKYNQIKIRVLKLYLKAIYNSREPLSSIYGGLKGLSCLGEEMIKNFFIPAIPHISKRTCTIFEKIANFGNPHAETKQVKYVIDLILNTAGPFLLRYNIADNPVSYIKEFGYLGYSLYNQVKILEKKNGI